MSEKYPEVIVKWTDSACYGGWQSPGQCEYKPATCTTRGFLIEKNRKIVAIASTVGHDNGRIGQFCDVMVIIRSTVTDIKLVKEQGD